MNKRSITLTVLSLSGAAMALLRRSLYSLAVDERGLLDGQHPLGIVLWVLTVAFAVAVILILRGENTPEFPRSPLFCALGCLALAVGAAVEFANGSFSGTGGLTRIADACAIAALAVVCLCLCRKKAVPDWPFAVISLFFAMTLVGAYRSWSSDPQLEDYVYSLGGLVCAMLAAYQCAAGKQGREKSRLLWTVLGGFFCFAGSASGDRMILSFTSGIFLTASLFLSPKKKEEA